MQEVNYVLVWFTIFICNIFSGVAAFGGNILALPFLSFMAPLNVIAPVLLVIGIVNNTMRSTIYFKDLKSKTFFKAISVMIIGALIGGNFFTRVPEDYAKLFLSIFMIVISIQNLYKFYKNGVKMANLNKYFKIVLLFGAGTFQYAFGCGGPFLALYLTNVIESKNEIRGMQASTFLIISIMGSINSFQAGNYTPAVIKLAILILPALFLACAISEWIVRRIDTALFKKLIYVMLLISGSVMCYESIKAVLF